MKKLVILLIISALTGLGYLGAQDQPIQPSVVKTGVYHGISPALRDLPALTDAEFEQLVIRSEQKMLNKKLRERHYPYASTAQPQGPDPVWQDQMGKTPGMKAPIMNISGQTSPYYPPDANGSAGPNHYMQTINTVYTIYNKSTGALVAGPTNLNLLFSGVTGAEYNDGDPICLYDEQADRWLVAEFSISGSNDYMLIAVSTTNDPTGTWHKYSFDVADMPDYEKFGIWQDGYYMGTNNSTGNDIYVFERSKMLDGLTAQMVGFNNPWRPTTIDGFMCVPPVDNDGTFAPAGSPGLFITINDDAIGGGTDQLWIYELAVNWTTPSNSTFTRSQQITVPAFDSNFGSNWDNIKQPNTTRELDAIPMVIMNVPQYRNFGSYQTIVCCHTVDVDNTDHAGIRWYELRRTTGTWTVRQSGTYAPDANSRWMGSIALNGNNQIGLGYSISSSTVYPGIRYSGQSASAYTSGNGVLDIAEEVIQNATSSQTSYNRWGDYAGICVDPSDNNTFWFTTQYGGSRQTRIASFAFSNPPLTAAFSGTPTTVCTGSQVTFTDQSLGSPNSWTWSFPGGTPSSSTLQNPVIAYNTPGTYDVTLTVGNGSTTDVLTKTAYISVADISANFSGSPTTVTVGNSVVFTDNTSCNPTSWNWSFPGGTPSSSTSQNPTVFYNTIGTYSVTLTATNASGSDTETKTNYITVNEVSISYCASQGNDFSDEWIARVQFNTFVNPSGAAGYSDFTNLTIPMTPGTSTSVTLTPGFSGSSYREYWRVWIDYNKDGDFLDAGETVFAPAGSKTAVTGSFTVPSGLSGTTRMRVSMKYNAAPASCEIFAYGEVEDYTVSFGTPQPPVANFSANPTTAITGQSIQFTDLSTNAPASWAWTFTGGTPSTSTAQNPVVSYANPGVYDVTLTATNAAGSDTETKAGYITVVEVPSCTSPVSPMNGASGVGIAAILQWNSVTDATGYTLYFGTNNPPTNILNGTNVGNTTSYDPAGDLLYSTTYYWKVVPYNANGSPAGCSVWSFTTEASPYSTVELSYSDFESGWGIWTDGGGDCAMYTGGTYASGGIAAIDIQDNSATASSFYHTNGVDVHTPGYVQIDVQFDFITVSMETNEDFWVQYFNGTTWYTVASYKSGTNFSNNIFYQANVSILESNYTFPTGMKIRFMCDASDNNDDVYIDNVKITASTLASPNNYLIPLAGPQKELDQQESAMASVNIYPNPAGENINIDLSDPRPAEIFIYDIQGKVVYHGLTQNQNNNISLMDFRNGLYMVLVITREESFKGKFVKK
ncbi:MAG: PKD domain-containing protein [Bacteroidales bacterium]|jgi:PKD repeat protein|nr:PKD domain-containing protein [Bacteroidales bacterium]